MKAGAPALLLVVLLLATSAAAPSALPVYIEDNHAGSFYWLASQLDPGEHCTLLHFDAHSDASGIFDSDKIRAALDQVSSEEQRRQLLEQWRAAGAVQCFDWIEPLFPERIARVIWVPALKLADSALQEKQAEARRQFDGHLEAAPRKAGPVGDRYMVSDLEHLAGKLSADERLVVTIDLDFFAELAEEDQGRAFARVWEFVIRRANLRAVTFAISPPYLPNGPVADRLLKLALDAALSLPTARVQYEPFLSVAHDRSLRAREFAARGQPVPAYEVASASPALRARLLSQSERIAVTHDRSRWNDLLQAWRASAPQIHLAIKDAEPSTDGAWRVPAQEAAEIQLVTEPWTAKREQIEWSVLAPEFTCCNVTALRADQAGFVAGAAPRPAWREIPLTTSAESLQVADLDQFFSAANHCGSLRLRARAVVAGQLRETAVMELRRFERTGFRAALSEQFGLPYLFGSGQLFDGPNSGPETNLGADCANFVVCALRRQGLRIPWCDPKQLRQYLERTAAAAKPGETRINQGDLQNGLLVHLGTHVAAVMEDRPPLGLLDGNDLVAHQLKGLPEIIPLGQLLSSRKQATFDLYKVQPAAALADQPQSAGGLESFERTLASAPSLLFFGGDIMMGRSVAAKITRGIDPFRGIHDLLAHSQFAAANLECTIATRGEPARDQRYTFRAPAIAATLLHQNGFQAVGLANNHALDFGVPALRECANNLKQAKVAAIGLTNDSEAPQIFSLPNGARLALLAISDLPGESSAGAINLNADRAKLAQTIADARSQADLVACLVHWGVENTASTTERQRELARWLIDHGVDLIAGSHPHCLQPLDTYHGRTIAYSLGNLVFDGAPGVAAWNHGALLQITLSRAGRLTSAALVPIVLKDGLPNALADPGSKSETMVAK